MTISSLWLESLYWYCLFIKSAHSWLNTQERGQVNKMFYHQRQFMLCPCGVSQPESHLAIDYNKVL